ncbi:MAG: hypothetical protein JST05_02645 [Acidobacteria bacterium]|nr:hypothetical protein [Acidobacteriota bacterium]
MRTFSLATPAVLLFCAVCGCARKGDPVPRPLAPPQAPRAKWDTPLRLEVTLPELDSNQESLRGLDAIRILYLPLGLSRPEPQEVFSRGEVVLTLQRPSLPKPGETVFVDLRSLHRPAGWIVVVAVRAGGISGAPSQSLAWFDPRLGGGPWGDS